MCIRTDIDYAAPVFHFALPLYLVNELERLQKRAMRIICPNVEYRYALSTLGLTTINDHGPVVRKPISTNPGLNI